MFNSVSNRVKRLSVVIRQAKRKYYLKPISKTELKFIQHSKQNDHTLIKFSIFLSSFMGALFLVLFFKF